MKLQIGLLVCGLSVVGFASTAEAVNVTPSVSQDCRWDYHNFCSDYGLGSALLNICFKQNGAKLSPSCVAALEQAGDVSRTYVQSREKHHHH